MASRRGQGGTAFGQAARYSGTTGSVASPPASRLVSETRPSSGGGGGGSSPQPSPTTITPAQTATALIQYESLSPAERANLILQTGGTSSPYYSYEEYKISAGATPSAAISSTPSPAAPTQAQIAASDTGKVSLVDVKTGMPKPTLLPVSTYRPVREDRPLSFIDPLKPIRSDTTYLLPVTEYHRGAGTLREGIWIPADTSSVISVGDRRPALSETLETRQITYDISRDISLQPRVSAGEPSMFDEQLIAYRKERAKEYGSRIGIFSGETKWYDFGRISERAATASKIKFQEGDIFGGLSIYGGIAFVSGALKPAKEIATNNPIISLKNLFVSAWETGGIAVKAGQEIVTIPLKAAKRQPLFAGLKQAVSPITSQIKSNPFGFAGEQTAYFAMFSGAGRVAKSKPVTKVYKKVSNWYNFGSFNFAKGGKYVEKISISGYQQTLKGVPISRTEIIRRRTEAGLDSNILFGKKIRESPQKTIQLDPFTRKPVQKTLVDSSFEVIDLSKSEGLGYYKGAPKGAKRIGFDNIGKVFEDVRPARTYMNEGALMNFLSTYGEKGYKIRRVDDYFPQKYTGKARAGKAAPELPFYMRNIDRATRQSSFLEFADKLKWKDLSTGYFKSLPSKRDALLSTLPEKRGKITFSELFWKPFIGKKAMGDILLVQPELVSTEIFSSRIPSGRIGGGRKSIRTEPELFDEFVTSGGQRRPSRIGLGAISQGIGIGTQSMAGQQYISEPELITDTLLGEGGFRVPYQDLRGRYKQTQITDIKPDEEFEIKIIPIINIAGKEATETNIDVRSDKDIRLDYFPILDIPEIPPPDGGGDGWGIEGGRPPPPPKEGGGGFIFPSLEFGEKKKRKRGKKGRKFKTYYVPDLTAAILGDVGAKPTKLEIASGLVGLPFIK